MHARRKSVFIVILFAMFLVESAATGSAAARKGHTVVLGGARKVPYSKAGDPAGAAGRRGLAEDSRAARGRRGEGMDHRRAARRDRPQLRGAARDSAERRFASAKSRPGRQPWVWQRGPWLLVDRVTGHETALQLPDYDPGVSQVSWFRDYAAYCGVTASGKSLYAVVAQVAARKPVLAKKAWGLRFRRERKPTPTPCALPPDVAAGTSAGHLSSPGPGSGELRYRSRFRGAGGRHRRRKRRRTQRRRSSASASQRVGRPAARWRIEPPDELVWHAAALTPNRPHISYLFRLSFGNPRRDETGRYCFLPLRGAQRGVVSNRKQAVVGILSVCRWGWTG